MAQLSDDCFVNSGHLLSLDAALADLTVRLQPIAGFEEVLLSRGLGRILARTLSANITVPAYDNSAVDGYAVRHGDLHPDAETTLPVIGRAAAGHPFHEAVPARTALRILTGAPMPPELDTVMMQEDCVREGPYVRMRPGIKKGANRRLAGEDVSAGDTILSSGRRLRPQDIGMAAAQGLQTLPVYRPLRIAVFSTGDEVCEPGQPLPAGHIYDSNRFTLTALLMQQGFAVTDLGILPDRLDVLTRRLGDAVRTHDAVVSSGGVSTGDEDHVKAAVTALGRLDFWRLAIKPGRPVALGLIDGKAYFGLPGNPVAAMITYLRFARPLLARLQGVVPEPLRSLQVTADFSYRKKAGRLEWVRARLVDDGTGHYRAVKFPRDGAGILSSLVATEGLVELPEQCLSVAPGDTVAFLPYDMLLA